MSPCQLMLVTQGRQVQFITSRIERLIVMTGTPQKSSANKNGPYLNEFLKAGPCLLPKILDILVRFRAYKYGLTSDIKAAFLNIREVEEDRDFLRFLWISNFVENEPEVVVKRFTSVVFGLNCSPFLLGATIKDHM